MLLYKEPRIDEKAKTVAESKKRNGKDLRRSRCGKALQQKEIKKSNSRSSPRQNS